MTVHDRLAAALDRLAVATGVHRVRSHDAEREQRNGVPDVREKGAKARASRLERAAAALEDRLP